MTDIKTIYDFIGDCMSITSSLAQNGKELVISVSGRFDFSSLQLFRNAYESSNGAPTSYTIDLKGSEYVDSSALGMLLALRDYAGGDEAKVKIINCSSDIKKIFVVTKLDELFKIE